METFEEAIRDHLRLREGQAPSDEHLLELLGPEDPSFPESSEAGPRAPGPRGSESPPVYSLPVERPGGPVERPGGQANVGPTARGNVLSETEVRSKKPRPSRNLPGGLRQASLPFRRRASQSRSLRGRSQLARPLATGLVLLGLVAVGARLLAEESPAQKGAQKKLAAAPQYEQVADRIARGWMRWQLPDGRFRDYISGRRTAQYGSGMIGYAMLRAGQRSNDSQMIRAGVRAITAQTRRFGQKFGVFDLLVLSEAYGFARTRLAADPAFRDARPRWKRVLSSVGQPYVGEGAYRCVVEPECFHNHEAVEAAADTVALTTRVKSSTPGTKLGDRGALREKIRVTVAGQAPVVVRGAARSSGPGPRRSLGLLSDTPTYPLAYHALSSAMLGRALRAGPTSPARGRVAFARATESLASLMGPDGDVAYIGRRQQHAWALAAASYVGEAAANEFRGAPDRVARFQTLAGRSLERLARVHRFGPSGINAIPRFGRGTRSYVGTDADNITASGLTAYLLNLAADEAAAAPRLPPATLTADRDGFFLDPSQARFAAVRRGRVWYAVHADQEGFKDPRGDFGLVAVKWRKSDGTWSDLLRPRPLSGPRSAQAGPAIITVASERLLFYGQRLEVRPGGVVAIRGRFTGVSESRPATIDFIPVADGVRIRFPVRVGDVAEATTFLDAREARRQAGGVTDGSMWASFSPPASEVALEPGFASCCDSRLVAATMSVRPSRPEELSYTVRARPDLP